MTDMRDVDIAPELTLPDGPLWRVLEALRETFGQAPGTLWRYAVGDVQLVVNASRLSTHVEDPVPFDIDPETCIAFMGRGILGYITRRRSRFFPNGEGVVRAVLEETFAERRALLPKVDPLAGVPVCEECGVSLGEFPGDRINAERTGGVCEQCLTFGRGWLNRPTKRKPNAEL